MTVAEFLAWDAGMASFGSSWTESRKRWRPPWGHTGGALQEAYREPSCGAVELVRRARERGRCSAVRIPVLAVICSEYEPEEPVIANPVLIVAILSPTDEAETWANVWVNTTIPSVREIVVLRTVSIGADRLRRRPDGFWSWTPKAIDAEDLALESIGFRAPLTALYRTTRLAGRSGAADG
jgi:hypothetical protein